MICGGVVLLFLVLLLLFLLAFLLLFLLLPLERWVMVVLIARLMEMVDGRRMMSGYRRILKRVHLRRN